jgi:hypothetical protein
MKPGILRRLNPLRRKSPLRRRARPVEDRVAPALWQEVMWRDQFICIAKRFDPGHVCQGRLTFEHVPEEGYNAFGVRAPSDKYHGVAACLGANSPEGWCSTHRDDERAWLNVHYGPPPYPREEARDGDRAAV